jgi:hypothetical protein
MILGTSIEEQDRGSQEGEDDISSTSEHTELPLDVIFGLLSSQRRRRVLSYLTEDGDNTTLSDLAEHIAAEENDTGIRFLNSQQRKRVYVALYQCHLPKMDDADVIEFNQSRGTVERRPNADQLYAYLAAGPTYSGKDDRSQSEETPDIRGRLSNLFS